MSWRLLKKPYEVVPNVYDITTRREWGRRYRCYLVDGDAPTLVDTCHDEDGPKATLFEGLDELGVEPERLFVTHGDGDHVGGFDAVVDRYGVETWMPAETEAETAREPDHRYGDGDRFGGFEAVHVPGHEADSYALVNEDDGFAVLGDTVVGADVRGLPAGYFSVHGETYTDDPRAAERNLSKLTAYDFEAGLVFHGSSVLEAASGKIEAYVDGPKRDR
ncbi:MBL fold metallo-hydrolase [Haloplanus sp. GCM10025708]|uniref:MBL fold metallo-hydrolase n=1 Tax=Haloferacaceae TaxID=1644056 RepID=UPI00360C26F3